MADYVTKNDGRLHTRYSDLARCTPGGVERVALEYLGKVKRFEGGHQQHFGTDRHEMFQEESESTGLTPYCFKDELEFECEATYIEKEFTVKIGKDVVLHSRPDCVSVPTRRIIDYKTITGAASQFKHSKQLRVYAYQLAQIGIKIERLTWLCEVWDIERTKIIRYEVVEIEIGLRDLVDIKRWIDDRIFVLQTAIKSLS